MRRGEYFSMQHLRVRCLSLSLSAEHQYVSGCCKLRWLLSVNSQEFRWSAHHSTLYNLDIPFQNTASQCPLHPIYLMALPIQSYLKQNSSIIHNNFVYICSFSEHSSKGKYTLKDYIYDLSGGSRWSVRTCKGFRTGQSHQTVGLKVTGDVSNALDRSSIVLPYFTDLWKAFRAVGPWVTTFRVSSAALHQCSEPSQEQISLRKYSNLCVHECPNSSLVIVRITLSNT